MNKTLILTFDVQSKNVRTVVYRATLEYIMENLSNATVYKFANNQDLLKYVREHTFSSVISTNEILPDTAFILKGMGLVQIVIGMRKELMDISDIIIDPLIRNSEKYVTGTGYLLPSLLTNIPVKSLADIIGIDMDTLVEEASHNEAENDLLDVAQLCQKLQWDSNFFGINVGYLSCLRLTPNIEKHVKKFVRKEKIDLLEYRCNCHDRESVVTSENNGYSFVDIRLTYENVLKNNNKVRDRKHYSVRKGCDCDIEKLQKIATDIYKDSRYYFDDNFDKDKVITFYVDWVAKAIKGQFDDYAYVLYDNKEPIGFCTIKEIRKKVVRIGLFGMNSKYRGEGLATYLLGKSLQNLSEQGFDYVEVVTQGRNYAAQRLYQKCGFVTKSTELWYHKWFH